MIGVKEKPLPGPYTPTLIIHGGAGDITRQNLPPELYAQYEASLLRYLHSTRESLFSGSSALDAAVHAVSLMEDDPLFNCGRGSVFTEKGTIEMEASIMVTSLGASTGSERDGRRRQDDDLSRAAEEKRGAGVMLIRNTRHPILLAKEVLLVQPNAKASSMHCQLSGREVEEWGWRERGLEKKEDGWFWTKRRWDEHRRGLKKDCCREMNNSTDATSIDGGCDHSLHGEEKGQKSEGEDERSAGNLSDILPSQGTVGAICMDSWGDLAVATSTGGLTNKKVGRIGDTPTLGAGFWAESWQQKLEPPGPVAEPAPSLRTVIGSEATTMMHIATHAIDQRLWKWLYPCLSWKPHTSEQRQLMPTMKSKSTEKAVLDDNLILEQPKLVSASRTMNLARAPSFSNPRFRLRSRSVAISGTGNGDTFLRTAACRTTAAIARFSHHTPSSRPASLAEAMKLTAGLNGELQKSAGDRWKVTGEGQAGMIGIEVCCDVPLDGAHDKSSTPPTVEPPGFECLIVSDFNCAGLWRAFVDEQTGKGKVMVFKEAYK